MAGKFLVINGSVAHIDLPDGKGSAVVNGRTYRWYFHDYCGPEFVDAHDAHYKARKTVPYTQTVEC